GLVPDDAHSGIGRVPLQDLTRVIGRCVVDDDRLKVVYGLREQAVERLWQVAAVVVRSDDHRNQGRSMIAPFNRWHGAHPCSCSGTWKLTSLEKVTANLCNLVPRHSAIKQRGDAVGKATSDDRHPDRKVAE